MSHERASSSLPRLSLSRCPLALAKVTQAPARVTTEPAPAASSRAFWRRAETEVFFAAAEAHREFAVGAHAMALPMPAATQQELGALAERRDRILPSTAAMLERDPAKHDAFA